MDESLNESLKENSNKVLAENQDEILAEELETAPVEVSGAVPEEIFEIIPVEPTETTEVPAEIPETKSEEISEINELNISADDTELIYQPEEDVLTPLAAAEDFPDFSDVSETAENNIPEPVPFDPEADLKRVNLTEEEVKDYKNVFEDMVDFNKDLAEKYDFYPGVFDMIKTGKVELEVRKRYMIKAIDEIWLNVIEDAIIHLDAVIRKPTKFIIENDEVLPIEISRNITSRSLRHLTQHTDYISKIEDDGMIIPSKILNVFKEETMLTYENKFVNTVILKLYIFVNKRYRQVIEMEKDEKNTILNLKTNFENGSMKGKINFTVEISEEPEEGAEVHNHTFTKEQWRRVIKLNSVVNEYINSPFVKEMGKNYIRPPVMRTNAINKNKDLRQCLALYEFVESYENVGYDMLIQESVESIDEDYVKQLYSVAAAQYMMFRYKINNEFDKARSFDTTETDSPLAPKYIEEAREYFSSDFDVYDTRYGRVVNFSELKKKNRLSPDELLIREAIEVALEADKLRIVTALPIIPEVVEEVIFYEPEEDIVEVTKDKFKSKKSIGRKRKKKIKEKVATNANLNDIEQFFYEKMTGKQEDDPD